MRNCITIPIVLCVLTGFLPAQDPGSSRGPGSSLLTYQEGEVVLHRIEPEFASVLQIRDVVSKIYGSSFFVMEGDGRKRGPIRNVMTMRNALMIYDTPGHIEKIQKLVMRLDIPPEKQEKRTEKTIRTYKARNLARHALFRSGSVWIEQKWSSRAPVSMDELSDASSILLSGTDSAVAQLAQFLSSIDVAPVRFRLTCLVVKANEKNATVPVPQPLLQQLKKLLPYESFGGRAIGMVNAVLSPNSPITLDMETGTETAASVRLLPGQWDPKTRVMRFGMCECKLIDRKADTKQRLSSQIELKAGEYTVLGALGHQPELVVLRVDVEA